MREMKSSGVAWIGNIPKAWGLIRYKDKYKNSKEIAGDKSRSYERLALTLNGVIKRPKDDSDGLQPKEFDTYQVLHENDFVFKMIDLQNISTSRVGLSPYTGLVSPAYIRFCPKNKKQYPRFIYYFLMSMYYNCVFNNLGGDGVRSALNSSDMGMLLIPYPIEIEQHRIADYLDTACSKVNSLIVNQQTQIEKLKQYKQSLITEVVTKGLNPDVPMKDSGVKWIGKIPNNWQTKKIKYVAKIIDDKYLKGEYNYIALENIESHSARFIKTDSVYDLVGTKMAYSDTVIFGKLRPYLAKVFLVKETTCVNNEFSVFKGLEVTNEYLKYFMLGSRFIDTVNASTYGTKMPRANIGFISNLQITIPPFQEQQNIANYLDDKCAKIDRLIAIKQEKINKLNNYKKSLIYEYVTGKKEA